MKPHEDCIDRLQSLIGCACIGDCLTEGRGTLLEKKAKKDERIAELENILWANHNLFLGTKMEWMQENLKNLAQAIYEAQEVRGE